MMLDTGYHHARKHLSAVLTRLPWLTVRFGECKSGEILLIFFTIRI